MSEPGNFLQPSVDFSRSRLETELAGQLAWLGRLARGHGFSGADAEDLAQTVAVTFLELIPRFEGRSSLRTFLFGIMRRKAAEMRRSARHRDHDNAALERIPGNNAAESGLANAELGHAIDECIQQLPPKQRDAARLRFQKERSTTDVGRLLGVSANHLAVLIHRAREHLRDCVGAHGMRP